MDSQRRWNARCSAKETNFPLTDIDMADIGRTSRQYFRFDSTPFAVTSSSRQTRDRKVCT